MTSDTDFKSSDIPIILQIEYTALYQAELHFYFLYQFMISIVKITGLLNFMAHTTWNFINSSANLEKRMNKSLPLLPYCWFLSCILYCLVIVLLTIGMIATPLQGEFSIMVLVKIWNGRLMYSNMSELPTIPKDMGVRGVSPKLIN